MLSNARNIKLYAKALHNKNSNKLYARIAGVTAAVTILGVTLNTVQANTVSKDGLVRTDIEVVDTINDTIEDTSTYTIKIGDNKQSAYESVIVKEDLNKKISFSELPDNTKDIVVYNSDWVLNKDNKKFERDIYTYYFDQDMKDFDKEDLIDISDYLVNSKKETKRSLNTEDAEKVESLCNVHITQDLGDTKYNSFGFLFQNFVGLCAGLLPAMYAVFSYAAYRKTKLNDLSKDELEMLRLDAINDYNKMLNNMDEIQMMDIQYELEDYNNFSEIYESNKLYYDALNDLLKGKNAEHTELFSKKLTK